MGNNSVYVGNVNPSGRGMNGAVYDASGVSPTLTTNKGEGIKVRTLSPPHRVIGNDDRRIEAVMPDMKDNALGNSPETKEADQPTFRVRKLTPKECWKLMGFEPSDYERARDAMNENIYNGRDRSGSQLYKQAGNSIVVDVLLHIMENLYEAMPYLFEDIQVGSFFSGIGAFEKALTRLNPDVSAETGDGVDLELTQIGYINNYNGDANRIYDGSAVARVLKAEAGGGGAKTGWYRVDPPPQLRNL